MDIHLTPLLPLALLVDLPEIDGQHEGIFFQIESLRTACFDNGLVSTEAFESLLERFEHHFSTEERMAEEAGIDFSEHAGIHQATLRLLRRALNEVENGIRDAHSFLRFAEYWFERHISEDDRRFAAALKARRRRSIYKRRRDAEQIRATPL